MGGDGGGSGAKWGEEGEGRGDIERLLRVALYGLGAAVLGHLALARGGQRERGKEKREEPFSGEDTDPLWLRAIAWLVGCLLSLGELSVVKILCVLVQSCVYYASKAPFYVQSLLVQRGSRVWRDVEYGPRPRNRLDVYRPEPALSAACGSGEYGRAVIMMVHGGAWFWGDKLYFAKVQGASFPDCTVVPINYTLHPHADCEQVPPLFQLNNLHQKLKLIFSVLLVAACVRACGVSCRVQGLVTSLRSGIVLTNVHTRRVCGCWRQMVKDVSLAIGWTYQNLCRADRLPLVVMGHSAGAHLVMLCASYRSKGNLLNRM
jgi:hypothetical protein